MKEKSSILWFQDGIKLKSPDHQWATIDHLTNELIRLVGHPDFKHRIVFPEQCRNKIELPLTSDTTIVDLTGFVTQRETQQLPAIPVIGKFRVSRMRNVSSSRLDGSGFTLSMDPTEINGLKSAVHFENPIVIDDVAWSGRTAIETIRILGIDPTKTTFAALALNVGNFGENKPGAMDFLKQKGIKQVIGGELVRTPEDDGFHLADFFEHRSIANKEVFGVIIHIQKLRELLNVSDESQRKQIEQEIKTLLTDHRSVLFPQAKSTEQVKRLQEEGKVVTQGGIPKDSFFDTNPPNWLMPSFSKRVQASMLVTHIDEIVDVLKRFNDILVSRRFM